MGLAAAAILGPAALASLGRAAKNRMSGAVPAGGQFWFYVTQPTAVFGIEAYNDVVGELTPGDWFLAQGRHDEWVHVSDEATGIEGWVSGESAHPAS